jgi:hypothetical protein
MSGLCNVAKLQKKDRKQRQLIICDLSMPEPAVEAEIYGKRGLRGKVKFLEKHIRQLQNVIERQ